MTTRRFDTGDPLRLNPESELETNAPPTPLREHCSEEDARTSVDPPTPVPLNPVVDH